MQDIIIDEEFRQLLPTLDKQTYALLEANILEHGCRDALVTWNGMLIDGYNRYRVCTEHNVPFKTVSKEFASREEVLIWIISNQVSRRNLTPIQLSHYRGLHYRVDKKIQGSNNQHVRKSEKGHYDPFQPSTASRLAGQYRVSPKTIKRDSKVALAIDAIGEISPDAKRMILSGEVSIDKKVLERLSSWSKDDVNELAARIEDGTYEKKRRESASQAVSAESDSAEGWSAAPKAPVREESAVEFPEAQPFQAVIARISDELLFEIRKRSEHGVTAEVKSSLRSFIDSLEELYREIG